MLISNITKQSLVIFDITVNLKYIKYKRKIYHLEYGNPSKK